MRRVSTDMPNNDMQYYMRRQEQGLNDIQTKMASNTRIKELRDDPIAASHSVRYASYLTRLERFETNAIYARDHYRVTDSYLRQSVDMLQRIRELALQGAHGTFTSDDLRNMAAEVNEFLKEIADMANATGPDGTRLFAGDKAFTEPFRIVEGTVAGGGESMVVSVEYRGAGSDRKAEISEYAYSSLDIGGGEAFWAEKMQIHSTIDATEYRAVAPGVFYIDGVEIQINPGDTLSAVIAKINDSSAPVKAYMEPRTRGLALEGTNAHLIRMEDRQEDPAGGPVSHVLRDLGIINDSTDPGAPNWHNAARVSGGSVFDMVIRLRDAFLRGDQDFIGSQGVGGIDLALGNVTARTAELGSRHERAEAAWKRLNENIPNATAHLARESALDYTTAATDLSMMDFAHRAALQTAAKVIPPTLLDFLR